MPWGKNERHNPSLLSNQKQHRTNKRVNSPTTTTRFDELGVTTDAVSLPDVNDEDWNDDDDGNENSIILDDIHSNTPILDRPTRKNQNLRRRQTIDTAQGRQYASHRQHQTPLKQLQAIFWPARHTYRSTINSNHQLNEHEQQIPMINRNQTTTTTTTTVRRSSSVREKTPNMISESLNE